MSGLKKWIAFGSGVGIQITGPRGAESLHIAAARVRPSGVRLAGSMTVEDFPHQPAGVWGTEYAAFLRKLGLRQAVATVILPRAAVIVRPLALPGVSNKDLDNAVRFQMDGLHPYNDDDVYSTWTRLPGTSTVLVAVARKDAVERYAAPFEEAGIRVRGFTCSAAAVYSALRLFGAKPAPELLAVDDSAGELEFYGESPTRPVFSASFDPANERAAALAASELRIRPDAEPVPLASLLGPQLLSEATALSFAAALSSACPRLSLSLNLLPIERRQAGSRMRWAPSVAFGALALLLVGALAAFPSYENRKYLRSLQADIAAINPQAERAAAIDKQVETLRRRIQLLDDLRRHPRADMDVLAELTRILPPPTWLNFMQISPKQVILGGETTEAAQLVPLLDSSHLFEASEFQAAPGRLPGSEQFRSGGESFRIKTLREGVK
ncbi:MAG TPA: PilN domain-containing protein [Bryobacteraceae bacterium]|jgi:hypothetical protein